MATDIGGHAGPTDPLPVPHWQACWPAGDSFDAVIVLVVSSSSSSDQSVPGPPVRFFVRPTRDRGGGRAPARSSPSLSPRTHPAASPSPLLSSSDSATINIWCSGRQTDSSRLLQAAGRGGRPGGPGRAACCCLVERQYGAGWPERVGEAINILKAVSSYCNQPLSSADWLACSLVQLARTSPPRRHIAATSPLRAVPSTRPATQSLDPITTYWSPPVIRPIILSPLRWP